MIADTLDEARTQWGKVFRAFSLACGQVNRARYQVEDIQALKQEDIARLRALMSSAQKEIDAWEQWRVQS